MGERAPLAEVREAVLGLRRGKGMVIDPADPDSVSAGSFFTNPVLTRADFDALRARAGLDPPAWPERDGRVKTSAAWLIERSGFTRGYGNGRARISTKHTLALVNRGGLHDRRARRPRPRDRGGRARTFAVELEPEPVFVGHAW